MPVPKKADGTGTSGEDHLDLLLNRDAGAQLHRRERGPVAELPGKSARCPLGNGRLTAVANAGSCAAKAGSFFARSYSSTALCWWGSPEPLPSSWSNSPGELQGRPRGRRRGLWMGSGMGCTARCHVRSLPSGMQQTPSLASLVPLSGLAQLLGALLPAQGAAVLLPVVAGGAHRGQGVAAVAVEQVSRLLGGDSEAEQQHNRPGRPVIPRS